jgi:transcriptional regulator with XRE-family HTH domain
MNITELPENIKHIRKQRRLSCSDLARMVDKDTSQISRWERGITEPSLEEIEKVFEAMGYSVKVVVREKGEYRV